MAYDPPLAWSGIELPDLSTDQAWEAERVKELFAKLDAAGSMLDTRLDAFTDWADFAPSWTNLSIGNGVQVAKWRRSAAMAQAFVTVQFGSTSTIGTAPTLILPTPTASWIGSSFAFDAGGGQYEDVSEGGSGRWNANVIVAGTTARLGFDQVATALAPATGQAVRWAPVTNLAPFQWTNAVAAPGPDRFSLWLQYPTS